MCTECELVEVLVGLFAVAVSRIGIQSWKLLCLTHRGDALVHSGNQITVSLYKSVQTIVVGVNSVAYVLFGHKTNRRRPLCGCGLCYFCFHHLIKFSFLEVTLM